MQRSSVETAVKERLVYGWLETPSGLQGNVLRMAVATPTANPTASVKDIFLYRQGT